ASHSATRRRSTTRRCNAPLAVVPTLLHGARVRGLWQAAVRRVEREPRQQQDEAPVATEPPARARAGRHRGTAHPRLYPLSPCGAGGEGRRSGFRPLLDRLLERAAQRRIATASISTRALAGNAATPIVARAGYGAEKKRP